MSKEYKFGGKEHPFSNFYPAPAEYEGLVYSTGEGAFQAAKTLDLEERKKFQDIEPGDAKRMGRRLELRSDWEKVKYKVMLEVLRSKFKDEQLKSKLLSTGTDTIIEDTTAWHDNIWGNCGCPKCKDKPGLNLLGRALMEVRQEIQATLD